MSSGRRTIDPARPQPEAVEAAAKELADGRLVVAPTETRYGLLARADRADAIERLLDAKMRGQKHPVAVFASGREEIERWAVVNEAAAKLTDAFLPGPLTLVLETRREWPSGVCDNDRLGIRWSSSPVIAALLNECGVPLTATSANLSGRGERERVEEIVADFGEAVSLYLDGGPLAGAISTVVDCTTGQVRVLREGAIAANAITAAAG